MIFMFTCVLSSCFLVAPVVESMLHAEACVHQEKFVAKVDLACGLRIHTRPGVFRNRRSYADLSDLHFA